MGIRDVLADFLSSEGSRDRAGRDDGGSDASGSDDAQGGGDGDSDPGDTGFDVELEELDQEAQVEALEGRLDEMEGNIEQQGSELETIKGSQQDVAEQLNEVNDTVRQLLGIYDQLTADVNPFMDGPTRDADPDAEGFGVVGGEEPDPDGDVVEAVVDGDDPDDAAVGGEEVDDAAGGSEESEEESATTIGLEDIRAEHDPDEDGDAAGDAVEAGTASETAEAAVLQDDEPRDNEIEVEATTSEDRMSQSNRREDASAWRDEDVDDVGERASQSTVALRSLADTYATEIIVFEWLTSLVSTAGPAATLRAIAYYEEIGWIDREVKAYLEDVLSGPDLDMNVDPSRDPTELTAEDHAESYEYIMKLDAVQRTIEDTGL